MNSRLIVNEEKGELFIDGHRRVAIEIITLLDFMDSLIGTRVAEVMMNNIESRLGKQDCQHILNAKPQASINEIASDLVESDRVAGIGVTKITFPEDKPNEILIETANPCVTKTTGGAKSFSTSYYCGAFSLFLRKELEVRDLVYDPKANVRKFRLTARGSR